MVNYFDCRWPANCGIGRFASEISKSDLSYSFSFFNSRNFPTSFKGMIETSRLRMSKDVNWISPGYTIPFYGFDKIAVTIHDLMHLNFKLYQSNFNKLYYRYLKYKAKNNLLIFTVSEYTKNEILQWCDIDPDKIVVCYNAVDVSCFNAEVDPIRYNKPYILYVGNAKSHKNLDNLITGFYLSKKFEDYDLILSCNSTQYLNFLIQKLNLSQHIQFIGGISEEHLASYYKGASATLLVSLYEGFGIPILESMAVGTPVITSNLASMPEVSGKASLLVEPRSPHDIGEKLRYLLDNERVRRDLASKGFKRVEQFSWERSRRIWDDALIQFLEG